MWNYTARIAITVREETCKLLYKFWDKKSFHVFMKLVGMREVKIAGLIVSKQSVLTPCKGQGQTVSKE